MLIALSGTVCFVVLFVLKYMQDYTLLQLSYLWEFVIFSILAFAVALLSFVTQTKRTMQKPAEATAESDNLLFYGHIQKYDFNDI